MKSYEEFLLQEEQIDEVVKPVMGAIQGGFNALKNPVSTMHSLKGKFESGKGLGDAVKNVDPENALKTTIGLASAPAGIATSIADATFRNPDMQKWQRDRPIPDSKVTGR